MAAWAYFGTQQVIGLSGKKRARFYKETLAGVGRIW